MSGIGHSSFAFAKPSPLIQNSFIPDQTISINSTPCGTFKKRMGIAHQYCFF